MITGAGGFVGHAIVQNLPSTELQIFPTYRKYVNFNRNAQFCDLSDSNMTNQNKAKRHFACRRYVEY